MDTYKFSRSKNDYDWMKTLKPKRDFMGGKIELPYFDENLRLFVNCKRDYRSEAGHKKLILMAAPNMTIAQLKNKIEMEFAELYPQEDTYRVGSLKDVTGYNITNGTLVADVFKHGDTVDVYPDIIHSDEF